MRILVIFVYEEIFYQCLDFIIRCFNLHLRVLLNYWVDNFKVIAEADEVFHLSLFLKLVGFWPISFRGDLLNWLFSCQGMIIIYFFRLLNIIHYPRFFKKLIPIPLINSCSNNCLTVALYDCLLTKHISNIDLQFVLILSG